MKPFKLVYIPEYKEVRKLENLDVIFSTKLNKELGRYMNRTSILESVIDNVVRIWNEDEAEDQNGLSLIEIDDYLLDEGNCTQEEREIIIENLYTYINPNN
jgi:hypothetical protein